MKWSHLFYFDLFLNSLVRWSIDELNKQKQSKRKEKKRNKPTPRKAKREKLILYIFFFLLAPPPPPLSSLRHSPCDASSGVFGICSNSSRPACSSCWLVTSFSAQKIIPQPAKTKPFKLQSCPCPPSPPPAVVMATAELNDGVNFHQVDFTAASLVYCVHPSVDL